MIEELGKRFKGSLFCAVVVDKQSGYESEWFYWTGGNCQAIGLATRAATRIQQDMDDARKPDDD